MTDSLTRRAETLLDMMEQMKAIDDKIAEMCPKHTDNCGDYYTPCCDCPMKKRCLDDGHLDLDFKYDMEIFADYVDFCDRVQDERDEMEAEDERRRMDDAWEAANRWAGIDPSWATLPRVGRI